MSRALGRKLRHLAAIRSVPAAPFLRRLATFPADYLFGSGRSGKPLNVTLDLTYRCNLGCAFCFHPPEVKAKGGLGLSLDEIGSIVGDATGWASSFYLTGGEPLLREDLPEIVARIRTAGLTCGISTNGTLLTDSRIRELARARTSYLIVSLHSLDTESGDRRDVEGIERLGRGRGTMRLLLNFVLDGRNSGRLRDAMRLAETAQADALCVQHLGFLTLDERRAHELSLSTAAAVESKAAAALATTATVTTATVPPSVSGSDVARLIEDCDAARRGARVPLFFKPDLTAEKTRQWFLGGYRPSGICSYPWTDVRIDPDGSMRFCQFIPAKLGSALTPTGLLEAWNGDIYRALRRSLRAAGGTFPVCARCCKLYRST